MKCLNHSVFPEKLIEIGNKNVVNYNNMKVEYVNNLDISRSEKIAIDFENSDVKKMIINENQLKDLNYKGNITIKDNYDEIIRVINND